MKYAYIIFLFLFGIVACNKAPKEKNDLEKDGLKGKVKSTQEVRFDNCSEIDKDLPSYIGTRKEYNANGYMTGKTEYLFGLIGCSTSTTYQYNEDNLLIEELSDGYYLSAKTSYEYDELKRLTLEKQYYTSNGALSYTRSYKTDKQGNPLEIIFHEVGTESRNLFTGQKLSFEKVDRTTKEVFSYNYDKNNITESTQISYDTNNEKSQSVTKKYDKYQNLIEEKTIQEKLDSLGNSVEMITKEHLYIYDAENRLIKEIHIERNSPDRPNINNETIIYEYDSKGILTYSHKDIVKSDGKYEINITYEYDHHDNWIRSIYKNTNGCFIVEREINYYGEPEKAKLVVLLEKVKEQKLNEQYCSIESARNQVLHYMSMNYPDWEICTEIKITKTNDCVFNVQFQVINPHLRAYYIDKRQIVAELSIVENYTKYNFQVTRGHLY